MCITPNHNESFHDFFEIHSSAPTKNTLVALFSCPARHGNFSCTLNLHCMVTVFIPFFMLQRKKKAIENI